jgi:AraC-like DNA-binding protein
MTHLLPAFYFGLFLVGLLIGLALILRNRHSLAYTYFGIYNLITAWGFFVSFMLVSGLIMQYPSFFRTAAPLHYLWGPLCYLFVRNLLSSNNRFYKTDILHFLPFLLHFIELLPFYLTTRDYKIQVLSGMFSSGDRFGIYEGLLTSYWHSILKFSQMLIYSILQWRILYLFNRTQNQSFKENNKVIINWVTFVNITGTVMIITAQMHRIMMSGPVLFGISISDILFYMYYLGIWYYMLVKTELLSGIKLNHVVPAHEGFAIDDSTKLISRSTRGYEELIFKMETQMQVHQPFLDEKFNIALLAKQVNSPEYKISKAIKFKFGIHFPEYVNRYRIDYIEYNFSKNPEWKKYTIDGMALSAGFNSRNAFYAAFKKIKGITPTVFFNRS